MLKRLLFLLFLLLAAPALAQQQQVEAALKAASQGTRFGLLVVDEQGREVVSIQPDQRFIPASNTKLFTTAAAYAVLPGIDQPDKGAGTWLVLVPVRKQPPPVPFKSVRGGVWAEGIVVDDPVPDGGVDAVLYGQGDARMSSAADCKANCLAELADRVAAKTRRVRDVVGDDSFWPDQRWSAGMSWNNIGTDSGAAVSALNLDDNAMRLTVTPALGGQRPNIGIAPYFTVTNEATTSPPGGKLELFIERPVNGMTLRVYGSIPADARPWGERIGIDDPAHYAAWVFKRMLQARGVKVSGKVRVRHRPAMGYDRPYDPGPLGTPIAFGYNPFASLTPPPLADDVAVTNKVSQNLHAQVLFRRVGDLKGTGSEEWAAEALNKLFDRIGIPRAGYDFSDGSGMSTYNRLSPRATVALLRWVNTQPWGEAWYASLPIAGVDGTLKRRFKGTPLEGNLAAKTGSLNASNALSGRLRAKSGRMLTFAFFANDVPDGTSALPAMEAALLAIAAAN